MVPQTAIIFFGLGQRFQYKIAQKLFHRGKSAQFCLSKVRTFIMQTPKKYASHKTLIMCKYALVHLLLPTQILKVAYFCEHTC